MIDLLNVAVEELSNKFFVGEWGIELTVCLLYLHLSQYVILDIELTSNAIVAMLSCINLVLIAQFNPIEINLTSYRFIKDVGLLNFRLTTFDEVCQEGKDRLVKPSLNAIH